MPTAMRDWVIHRMTDFNETAQTVMKSWATLATEAERAKLPERVRDFAVGNFVLQKRQVRSCTIITRA